MKTIVVITENTSQVLMNALGANVGDKVIADIKWNPNFSQIRVHFESRPGYAYPLSYFIITHISIQLIGV